MFPSHISIPTRTSATLPSRARRNGKDQRVRMSFIVDDEQSLYGVGPLDDQNGGIQFEMQAGDIAVHAAGVAHRNVESSDDYTYVGLYPKGSPHWDNNHCNDDLEVTNAKRELAGSVLIPDYDPIYGRDGPLPKIWRSAASNVAP
ncbi:uncharacterized protein RCC_11009 [Ramularia collo-cygni]|uniref:Cupin type-1 domain-containing protein n=1 Tax=Ramularia collo-cygni TaxID=112498 RepID=A0A2D3VKY4_9PEZI|nr:uncharacterized protein RCC_11009 [Ramularia collo-cygni]CZT25281.1 uncharacterized protein RCC_11009 [Ramularia collo-cygni]